MRVEPAARGACHGHGDQRQDDDREEGVGREDREVNRPRHSGAAEGDRADARVVRQVAGQEEGRGREGGDHAGPVRLDAAAPDEDVSGRHQHGAGGVHRGVEFGKPAPGHAPSAAVRRTRTSAATNADAANSKVTVSDRAAPGSAASAAAPAPSPRIRLRIATP